jgi:hypothetical protein
MSQLTASETMPSELDLDMDQEIASLYEEEKPVCSCCGTTPPSDDEKSHLADFAPPLITVTPLPKSSRNKRKFEDAYLWAR